MIIIPKFLLNRCWVCFVLPDFQDLYRNVNGSHYLYTSIALIRYRSVIHSKKVKCWPAKLALERSPPSYSCKIQTYLIHVVNSIDERTWTTTHPYPRPSKYHLMNPHRQPNCFVKQKSFECSVYLKSHKTPFLLQQLYIIIFSLVSLRRK